MEHSSDDHRARVAALLAENPLSHAMNRNASYVVERALEFCDHEGRAMIAGPLLADPDVLLKLSQSQAGSHVVRGLVRPGQGTRQRVLEELRRLAPELQESKYAKPLLRELRSHVEAGPPLGSA
uniref:PUM-HD domain-containing protein n=1 Tax=Zooxanthella nutricula TaxID=1333877 RepID=A0A7S2K0T4_9DINO